MLIRIDLLFGSRLVNIVSITLSEVLMINYLLIFFGDLLSFEEVKINLPD